MKKLLHEKLRYIANENEEKLYSSNNIIEALCKEFGVCEHKSSYTVDLRNCLKAIADEIEKYYITRPRFEDGEPVQFGDYVDGCNGPVDSFLIYEDGSGTVYGEADLPYKVDDGAAAGIDEPHKRPKPKILDADGVEIKVGDVVWHVSEPGEVGEVETLIPASAHVCVLWSTGAELYTPGVDLAHREPDSLEKVRDDIAEWRADVAIPGNGWDIKTAEWCDRLTALIERGA